MASSSAGDVEAYSDLKDDQQKLVITTAAHALFNSLHDVEKHQCITVRKNVSADTLSKYVTTTLRAQQLPEEKRPAISLTDQEKAPPDTSKGQISMLLVGLYAIDVELPDYKVNAKAAAPPFLHYLPRDTKVLRVATPLKNPMTNVELFVLVDQEDGLCAPFKIHSKTCFYLPEYRNDSKSKASRATHWQNKVKDAGNSLAISSGEEPSSSEKFLAKARNTNSKDISRVVVDGTDKFANEVGYQFDMWLYSKGEKHAHRVFELLDIDKSKLHFDEQVSTIRNFFVKNALFGDVDFEKLKEIARKHWNSTGLDFEVGVLKSVRKAIHYFDVVVQERHYKPYLLLVLDRIKRTPEDWQSKKEGLLLDCKNMVEAMLTQSMRADITVDDTRAVFEVVCQKLKDICSGIKSRNEDLMDIPAERITEAKIPEIIDMVGDAVDKSELRVALGLIVRYGLEQVVDTNSDVVTSLEDVATDLQQLCIDHE